MKNALSQDDRRAAVQKMSNAGVSTRKIAAALGIAPSTVRLDRIALGITKAVMPFDDEQLANVVQWYKDGVSAAEMARRLGLPDKSVAWRLVQLERSGVLAKRERVVHNKGKKMPIREAHAAFAKKLFAIPNWQTTKRRDLAATMHMPFNEFLMKFKVLRNRGLIEPRAQGRRTAARDAGAASHRVAEAARNVDKTAKPEQRLDLWAIALGRPAA